MSSKNYRVSFITLGCRANQYETDAISSILCKNGFILVSPGEHADVAIINTCTVTAESDRKSRQMIRRAKRNASNVIVTGCFAEISPNAALDIDGVDAVIGNRDKSKVAKAAIKLCEKTELLKYSPSENFESCTELTGGMASHARAYIKIEDGCENKCAYCIIPKARGPVRSKPPADVIREGEHLAALGVKEIILCGIEISSYGKDLAGAYSLSELLRALSMIDGIERIRMGSLDPSSMRGDFPELISHLPKVMPHFHLSLQSGCTKTLAAMRRKYNSAQAAFFIENLRSHIPAAMISADIIAGFPGEDEKDFEESLSFLKKARLLHIHAFPFSIREGTEAASMPNQLPESVKKARVSELDKLDKNMRATLLSEYVNNNDLVRVLCETYVNNVARGHTEHFVEVEFECDRDPTDEIITVKLLRTDGSICYGIQA